MHTAYSRTMPKSTFSIQTTTCWLHMKSTCPLVREYRLSVLETMTTATSQVRQAIQDHLLVQAPAEAVTIPELQAAMSETAKQENSMLQAVAMWTRWILQTRFSSQAVMKLQVAVTPLADTVGLNSKREESYPLFNTFFKNSFHEHIHKHPSKNCSIRYCMKTDSFVLNLI